MLDKLATKTKYSVQYPLRDYTFPTETRAESVTFDERYMHIYLMDERIISVPLKWIPTLWHATPEDREQYAIGWDGRLIYWDPDECAINEDLLVENYLKFESSEQR